MVTVQTSCGIFRVLCLQTFFPVWLYVLLYCCRRILGPYIFKDHLYWRLCRGLVQSFLECPWGRWWVHSATPPRDFDVLPVPSPDPSFHVTMSVFGGIWLNDSHPFNYTFQVFCSSRLSNCWSHTTAELEITFGYEQQMKWEIQGIHICGCRCNERLKSKTDESKSLPYIGLLGELEHLTIVTSRLGE